MQRWTASCFLRLRMNWERLHGSAEKLEEAAEQYVLHRMPQTELVAFEEHLLVCEQCREAVEITDEFVQVFRLAATSLDPLPVQVALRQ